jgi:hypothetical protein
MIKKNESPTKQIRQNIDNARAVDKSRSILVLEFAS